MSTKYIYTFAVIMTVVVATLLAGIIVVLGPMAEKNADIFNKRQVLEAIRTPLAEAGQDIDVMSDETVLSIFKDQVQQTIVDADGEPMDGMEMEAIELDMAKERKKPLAERMYPVYEVNFDNKSYYIFSV
ncbi:MAG: NADH:ubiquinone reductase (Na(+)-transporting) subunit C, partial [Bacteroidota bacterium]